MGFLFIMMLIRLASLILHIFVKRGLLLLHHDLSSCFTNLCFFTASFMMMLIGMTLLILHAFTQCGFLLPHDLYFSLLDLSFFGNVFVFYDAYLVRIANLAYLSAMRSSSSP